MLIFQAFRISNFFFDSASENIEISNYLSMASDIQQFITTAHFLSFNFFLKRNNGPLLASNLPIFKLGQTDSATRRKSFWEAKNDLHLLKMETIAPLLQFWSVFIFGLTSLLGKTRFIF